MFSKHENLFKFALRECMFFSGFIRFTDPQNVCVDTKIITLCKFELDIFLKLDF